MIGIIGRGSFNLSLDTLARSKVFYGKVIEVHTVEAPVFVSVFFLDE
jgi:hypothetical protein